MDRKPNYLLGALVVIGIGFFIAERTLLKSDRGTAQSLVSSEKSIAAFPFENLSHDKSNAYFATGMQEEILTRLARIGALKLIARTSTQAFAA